MKQRIITALALIAAIIPMFFSHKWGIVIILIASALIAYEIVNFTSRSTDLFLILIFFAFIVLFGFEVRENIQLPLIALLLIILAVYTVLKSSLQIKDMAVGMFVAIIVAFAINVLYKIYSQNLKLLFYVFLVTYGADTGAYFIGSQFGKNKLAPLISPNKSVEGFIGGVGFSFILGFVFANFYLPQITTSTLVVIGLIMPMITQLGDLVFSLIKREFKVKDFGNAFPGHGGALDRTDSLLFGLLFISLLINLELLIV